jgi:hypothetical protein
MAVSAENNPTADLNFELEPIEVANQDRFRAGKPELETRSSGGFLAQELKGFEFIPGSQVTEGALSFRSETSE